MMLNLPSVLSSLVPAPFIKAPSAAITCSWLECGWKSYPLTPTAT
jgi:hypothetical protein